MNKPCKGRVPAENPDFESRHYAVYRNADGSFDWTIAHSPGWADNYSFPAMERFIELTHKRYEHRLGPYLGTTVKGIFTDEPSPPTPLPESVGTGAPWKLGLADFAGRVTYTTRVTVPSHPGNVKLRIDTGGLHTSVTLNGHTTGQRAWAPFEWSVPAGLRGKNAELKISIWTSVAPMFGDGRNPDAAWNEKFWVPPPNPRPDIGLLSAPEWVLN